MPTDRKFTGQKQDGTGLYYYNARYYDPQLGTFISPDTLVPFTLTSAAVKNVPGIVVALTTLAHCTNRSGDQMPGTASTL